MQLIIVTTILMANIFILRPTRADMSKLQWFNSTECSEVNIIKYKSISNDDTVAMLTIKDTSAISDIIKRIQSIPADGEKMKSWGDKAKRTLLTFTCANKQIQHIEFIEGKIKTPSTGFLTGQNTSEDNLYRDIDALVEPDLNKRLLKIKDQRIKFKNFTIAYTGEKNTPQPPGGPTIGPTTDTYFSIWQNDSANQVQVTIFEGQLPPQPQAFVADKKTLYLLTYENAAHESLKPQYFEISDKLPRRR